jgi:hypothetical protein
MDPSLQINERVDMVLIHYANASERLLCVPYEMKYHGQEIIFTVFGMRHPTEKGKRMIHIFEMSDGVNDYRLEYDAERLTWMLVSMIEGRDSYVA